MMARRPLVRSSWRAFALVVAAGTLAAPAAHAQTGDAALAEALFRGARTLVAAGNYAEACPKFAESQRIDPKLGTLMNLALCHASEGKTASAWAEYTQAAELAARAGQADRERVARKSASDLEAVLPHVVLKAATNDPMTVTWDGKTMGTAILGTALPVDPGAHELVASATGKKSFSQTVTVKPGPGEQTITIPALEPGSDAAAVVPVVPPSSTPPATAEAPYGHPILGYSLIGGGASAIIVGSIFGAMALSEKSAAGPLCNSTSCTQQGLNDISSLKTDEATSTIMFGAGILAAGAGIYFVVKSATHHEAAPSAPAARIDPLLGPGRAGLALSGSF